MRFSSVGGVVCVTVSSWQTCFGLFTVERTGSTLTTLAYLTLASALLPASAEALEAPASALRLQADRPVASTAAMATLSTLAVNLFITILSSVFVWRHGGMPLGTGANTCVAIERLSN